MKLPASSSQDSARGLVDSHSGQGVSGIHKPCRFRFRLGCARCRPSGSYTLATTPSQKNTESTVSMPPPHRMSCRAGERSDTLMIVASKAEVNQISPRIDSSASLLCCRVLLGASILAMCRTNPSRLTMATPSKQAARVVCAARRRLRARVLASAAMATRSIPRFRPLVTTSSWQVWAALRRHARLLVFLAESHSRRNARQLSAPRLAYSRVASRLLQFVSTRDSVFPGRHRCVGIRAGLD